MTEQLSVLFLDTNILLHFKPLREIDWTVIASTAAVRLVLCSPVLEELDEKKYDPKMADRARAAIAEIKRIDATNGRVRNNVSLETVIDDGTETRGNHDMAIIQCLLDYRSQHDGQPVAIVSDDFNMRKRCEAKGVSCSELEEQWRKPVEDENTRKLRQLQQENQRLKNRLPNLRLLVSHGPDATPVDLLDISLTEPARLDIETLLADVQKTHPKINAQGLNYDKHEADQYDSELDEFYSQYRKYLEDLAIHQNAKALTVDFSLWVENCGTCPASDVRVTLHLPERFLLVIDKEDVDQYINATSKRVDRNMELLFVGPRKPPAPKRPKSRMQQPGLETDLRAIHENALWPSPYIQQLTDLSAVMPKMDFHHSLEIDGNSIQLWAKKISHKDRDCIGTVVGVLNGWDSAVPFEVSYEIQTDEHPDGFAGKLAVRLAHTSV